MKLRHSATLVAGLIIAMIALRQARPETASPTVGQLAADLAALQARVTTLEGQVSDLQTTVSAQASQITSLQSAVANLQEVQIDLQNKLQFVSISGTNMFITGANLNIRNGVGTTAGEPNGLGNLIVGYNENAFPPSTQPRTGSHNIVVGTVNGYSSFGGLVAGQDNRISAPYATVTGGRGNAASGEWSSVSGGDSKTQATDAGWTGGSFSTP
jgi:hypothetical protein